MVCPHAAIRAKVYDGGVLTSAPSTFKSTLYRGNEHKGQHFTIQVAPGGLHGVQSVRQRLPRQGSDEPETQGDRHAPSGAAPRARARQLRLLPRYSRSPAHRVREDRSQELAVHGAAVRVFGRVRRLRRNALPEAADTALRRSTPHRQRDRLLVDLRRQSPDDAVHHQSRRPGSRVVQLALRRQRGVRLRISHGARRARHRGARARATPCVRDWRRPRHCTPRRGSVERSRNRSLSANAWSPFARSWIR